MNQKWSKRVPLEHTCSDRIRCSSLCNNADSSVDVDRPDCHKKPQWNSTCLQDLEHFVSLDRTERLSEVLEFYNCRKVVLLHLLNDWT